MTSSQENTSKTTVLISCDSSVNVGRMQDPCRSQVLVPGGFILASAALLELRRFHSAFIVCLSEGII